ncbi:YceG family protein [Gemella bergeri ATCC 700627]|uniref:Endolytic murein transglycosylase n=1 Tax=Gemella bergeri ATCC 700627 TaxID=1321820 RepID=U2QUG1_9BACL|nr:endolytic transglycosylase MltG [Gemella bergeri]ERK60171.1 YceG family protein [Gemella bergeri ATCC 700627]
MREDKIRRRNELRKKNKKNKKGGILSVFFTLLLVAAVAFLSYFYYGLTPVDKSNNNDIQIEVKESYGSQKIAEELKNKGLIRDAAIFKLYAKMKPSLSFYVGTFNLKPSMSVSQIMEELGTKDKARAGNTFAVIEGDSILKIAQNLEKTKKINAEEFLEKVNDAKFIGKLKEKFPELITNDIYGKNIKYALEGYLYPAVYTLDDNETAETLITKMVSVANEKIVPLYKENKRVWNIAGKDKQISIHEYITMASILEKESTKDGENTKIASVFLNRLAKGMLLQTDPSANYAADKLTGAPTQKELTLQSPYNTYVTKGLPPGPIASVGSVSFKALNNAEDTEYIYFLHASKDGKAYFSKTYEEHEQLAKEHIDGYIPTSR